MADHTQPRASCSRLPAPTDRHSTRHFASTLCACPPLAPSAATRGPRLLLRPQRQSTSQRGQKPLRTQRKLLHKGFALARAACMLSQPLCRQAYDHGLQGLPTMACLTPLCLLPLLPPLSVTVLTGSAPTAPPRTGSGDDRTCSPSYPCRFGWRECVRFSSNYNLV